MTILPFAIDMPKFGTHPVDLKARVLDAWTRAAFTSINPIFEIPA